MPKRLQRILRLVTEFVGSEGRRDTTELAERLGVSRRTLFRDIAELRAAGLTLRIDRASGGYEIDNTAPLLHALPDYTALASLLLSVALGDPPRSKEASNREIVAAQTLARNLPPKPRSACERLLEQRAWAIKEAPTDSREQHVDTVIHALASGQQLVVGVASIGEFRMRPSGLRKHAETWLIEGVSAEDAGPTAIDLSVVVYVNALPDTT